MGSGPCPGARGGGGTRCGGAPLQSRSGAGAGAQPGGVALPLCCTRVPKRLELPHLRGGHPTCSNGTRWSWRVVVAHASGREMLTFVVAYGASALPERNTRFWEAVLRHPMRLSPAPLLLVAGCTLLLSNPAAVPGLMSAGLHSHSPTPPGWACAPAVPPPLLLKGRRCPSTLSILVLWPPVTEGGPSSRAFALALQASTCCPNNTRQGVLKMWNCNLAAGLNSQRWSWSQQHWPCTNSSGLHATSLGMLACRGACGPGWQMSPSQRKLILKPWGKLQVPVAGELQA